MRIKSRLCCRLIPILVNDFSEITKSDEWTSFLEDYFEDTTSPTNFMHLYLTKKQNNSELRIIPESFFSQIDITEFDNDEKECVIIVPVKERGVIQHLQEQFRFKTNAFIFDLYSPPGFYLLEEKIKRLKSYILPIT